MKKLFITFTTIASFFFQFQAQSQVAQEREVVAKILDVRIGMTKKIPADLMVTVIGEVPTAGYSQVKLARVTYIMPPKDSIQDYVLYAVPPEGIAAQVISKVEASDTYFNYSQDAPWMKGIRIYGIGDGIKLGDITEFLIERESNALTENCSRLFVGLSNGGSIENALSDALLKLNKALEEGGVFDAMANWELKEIYGLYGGLPGYNEIRITIEAWRNPAWADIKSDRCNLEPDPGSCKAAFPRYYFDKKDKKCKEFTWGGCEGIVPFDTMEDCEKQCDCK